MTTENETTEGDEFIEITLPHDEIYALMTEAHKRDITLNQLINLILREMLDKEGWDPETSTFKRKES